MRLRIDALSPLLFGDGRPFGNNSDETRARGAFIPRPSTVAGLLRTQIGNANGAKWKNPEFLSQIKQIQVSPQILFREQAGMSEAVFPAPRDAVVYRDRDKQGRPQGEVTVAGLRPLELGADEGTDLPNGLRVLEDSSTGKPEAGYDWWLWSDLRKWLLGEETVPTPVPLPPVDERVHNELVAGKHTVSEGGLFTVEYRSWEEYAPDPSGEDRASKWFLGVEVETAGFATDALEATAHLGGERRPVALTKIQESFPVLDDELLAAITKSQQLRCTLVTPGLYGKGWRPSFNQFESFEDLQVEIVSAAVGPPEAVSGWSYEHGSRGPKPVRKMVPAGSTYFLQLSRQLTDREAQSMWLQATSDSETDRKDGFGAAVWGVWQ